jgi:phosphohistidine phosphatase SixA
MVQVLRYSQPLEEARMKLFFVMSGCGCSRGLNYVGEREIKAAADFLRKQNIDLSRARPLSSTYAVSIESAEIIQKSLHLPAPSVVNWLDESKSVRSIRARIEAFSNEYPNAGALLIVGHLSVIEIILEGFVEDFKLDFDVFTVKGSIHLVDTNARTVVQLFEP